MRETSGFPLLTVYAQADDAGVIAWLLRDYPNAVFITDPRAARAQPAVILPAHNDAPDLGGSYVGQRFVISTSWSPQTLQISDVPAWWLQRRVRVPGTPAESAVLWLRQDIYDGTTRSSNSPFG